ncbi:DUF1816 domain-containing protein [Lyngbya aestuarii]|uniref:DUF1816 domain-containing protein n=1 Tax=Lyngbya aestuarii TaxID=118322 RepID=UPI00403D8A41
MMMKLREKAENTFLSGLEKLRLAWWIKIITKNPYCIYYFGPFGSTEHAKAYQDGYLEDLQEEGAQIIALEIKQGQPRHLTIVEDELPDIFESNRSKSVFSNFVTPSSR